MTRRRRKINRRRWAPNEREAVARAVFGEGWQCCANLGPYVQGIINELNAARELNAFFEEFNPGVVARWRELTTGGENGS